MQIIMKIFYKPPFRKFVKKQIRPFQLVIEDEVEKIVINPDEGKAKKGDLTGFQVQKFSYRSQKFLIAYRIQEDKALKEAKKRGCARAVMGTGDRAFQRLPGLCLQIGTNVACMN